MAVENSLLDSRSSDTSGNYESQRQLDFRLINDTLKITSPLEHHTSTTLHSRQPQLEPAFRRL
jgi:hypothetical protein